MRSFATFPLSTRGRLYQEPESARRTAFQRDRDRIIHSTAFRRLKHKTQVFVYHEGDHYRTRLTHSIEVAQIARSIARSLGIDEDLAEAIALAHDLGHPPFGHAGEEALEACMQQFGGFDHNEQTFRVVTSLERRYALFDGLNLTWETLEGVVKHNGPLIGPRTRAKALARGIPPSIAEFSRSWNLELDGFPGPEAQVAAISDDIAYNNHDLDDGLRAGLFALGDLRGIPLVADVVGEVEALYGPIELGRQIHETIRRIIDRMVNDVIEETARRIAHHQIREVKDVRALDRPLVDFSEEMRANDLMLRRFLFERMYRHGRVNQMAAHARVVVRELFERISSDHNLLPEDWRALALTAPHTVERVIADYIAGMTDKFALESHAALYPERGRLP